MDQPHTTAPESGAESPGIAYPSSGLSQDGIESPGDINPTTPIYSLPQSAAKATALGAFKKGGEALRRGMPSALTPDTFGTDARLAPESKPTVPAKIYEKFEPETQEAYSA